MDQTFLQVLEHEGPVTIIAPYASPAPVVNTWMSYVKLNSEQTELYLPAAGMRSIEHVLPDDDRLLLTFGSKAVMGTEGPGAGFHVSGKGYFIADGPIYEEMKEQFPWLRKVLAVKITAVTQKI
ncbi:pyridoxamine 5'-phosphate oxidase family protein [Lactobacillus corticis]|uniref:FMN-binding protein n=1 Tax=Lactobacillus corticis TaxID=2201249 RepID=A0A916QIB9_9LACO|nr:pyridoxamine 5'-phosphate oxidase family protein [Lactobacillus corticis]GFZ27504.1 FMN-binding protein [Lactobacillus corticis]